MKADENRRYTSTRFTVLTDERSNGNARKNYFICITIATVFVCITVAYFSYKTFIAPTYFNYQNPNFSLSGTSSDHPEYSALKLYNPKAVLAGFRRKTSKDHRELTCEESQPQPEAIPAALIREILEKSFENVHDYVNLDLLLHYENTINRYDAASLRAIFNEYQLELWSVKNTGDFLNFLRILKSNKFEFYTNYLKGHNLELKKFESFFALTGELNHWYNYLSALNVILSDYDQQKFRNNTVNCTKETFEKFTEDTHKRLFRFVYHFTVTDKKLEEVNQVISAWAQPLKVEVANTSVVFYRKVLILSELNREIHRLNISCLKSVYFLASYTLFLDEDVELLGTNLAVISPNWVFLKKIKINLNGVDGRNTTDDADFGQSGKPGTPGGNAGDFIGVGNLEEKYLLITANGGKGGNGQNGAKGQNGANNTRPDPPVDKPSCASKLKSFKNNFGQMITHYKIYSNSGCGGSGTDGGVGGQGGAGGVITLISHNSVKVTKGLQGTAGSHGKGGAGGIGGRDGCFYEVLDINDEILHRVTSVKCQTGNTLPAGEFGKDNHNTQGQIFPPVKENLTLHESFYQYLWYTGFGGDFNPGTISILKQLNRPDVDLPDIKDIIREFKLVGEFDRIEFYEVFIDRINKYMQVSARPSLVYVQSILLGHVTVLKTNVNYFFIDLKNYLNIIKTDIKTTNERSREFQASDYLKRKVDVKMKQIILNLDQIQHRLTLLSNDSNNSFSCIMMKAIDKLRFLLTQTSDAMHSDSNVPFRSCSSNSTVDGNRGDALMETSLMHVRRTLKENFPTQDVRGHLEKLKDALCVAKDSDARSEEEKNLLEALTDEVEHFLALYYFADWERYENLFLTSLYNLSLLETSELQHKGLQPLKEELVNVLTGVRYSLAVDAVRQPFQLYPGRYKTTRYFQGASLAENVLTFPKDGSNQETVSFCGNHLKAVFDKNSAVGDFYYWANPAIRRKLRSLFWGSEIQLKSDLINRHVFDKNFVQFTSLKLELECPRNGNDCQRELNGVLDNFKMELTHSGYSYYNWKGETRLVVSEEVSLEYSFRVRDNNEPEIYNALYKKCQNGEVKLSPFTTWSVRLVPINEEADFKKLLSFADVVSLRLTGSGTYTT